jgi:hypothetical protein
MLARPSNHKKVKALAVVVAAVLVAPSALAQNVDSITKNYSEVSAKELRPEKGFPFDVVIEPSRPDGSRVLFNREYKGRLCFFSCHFYDGIISKWTNFFLEMQPYESTCFAIAGGCNNTSFESPRRSLKVRIGEQEFIINMTDPSRNQYYLPLSLRRAIIDKGANTVEIETGFSRYPSYRLGKNVSKKLSVVLDGAREVEHDLPASGMQRPKAQRLRELDELMQSGMISEAEYKKAREQIISD